MVIDVGNPCSPSSDPQINCKYILMVEPLSNCPYIVTLYDKTWSIKLPPVLLPGVTLFTVGEKW